MSRHWVVVGCGGHGREVAEVLRQALQNTDGRVLGYLDEDPNKAGTSLAGLPVLGDLSWLRQTPEPLSIAMGIGSSRMRKDLVTRIKEMGLPHNFPPVLHADARIGSRVSLGEGTLVQAGCILTCDIQVGAFVILNIGASLSHDVTVGDFATLAPGARMAGAVVIEELAEIGMNTSVIQNVRLGEACTTGAGAVVIRDVPRETTVVGVPAHSVGHMNPSNAPGF